MAYANRIVTCTNNDGVMARFTERAFSPFLLCSIEGVYTVENKVTVSENTMNDGATYQGSVARFRNIVIVFKDNTDHVYNRNLVNAVFKSGELGELVFEEDENKRKINYYVERITSDGAPFHRTYSVSLICTDPFFYAMNDVTVFLATWIGSFTFPHRFIAEREEFGYKSNSRWITIMNNNADDGIGLKATITAEGTIRNPSISRFESNESFKLGSETVPFVMNAGDILVITTADNNKHAYLTRDGLTTEVNQYITEDSEFIQLKRGENNIGYNADVGVDAMSVSISYRLKYASA